VPPRASAEYSRASARCGLSQHRTREDHEQICRIEEAQALRSRSPDRRYGLRPSRRPRRPRDGPPDPGRGTPAACRRRRASARRGRPPRSSRRPGRSRSRPQRRRDDLQLLVRLRPELRRRLLRSRLGRCVRLPVGLQPRGRRQLLHRRRELGHPSVRLPGHLRRRDLQQRRDHLRRRAGELLHCEENCGAICGDGCCNGGESGDPSSPGFCECDCGDDSEPISYNMCPLDFDCQDDGFGCGGWGPGECQDCAGCATCTTHRGAGIRRADHQQGPARRQPRGEGEPAPQGREVIQRRR
jgi:hypothetical protein